MNKTIRSKHGKSCAFPGCVAGSYQNKIERKKQGLKTLAMYSVPQDLELRKKWCEIIGKELKASNVLCENHFDEKNITREERIKLFDGSYYVRKYERCFLKKNSLPVLNKCFEIESEKDNDDSTLSKIINLETEFVDVNNVETNELHGDENQLFDSLSNPTVETLKEYFSSKPLPQNWSWTINPRNKKSLLLFHIDDHNFTIPFYVKIQNDTGIRIIDAEYNRKLNGSISFSIVNGKLDIQFNVDNYKSHVEKISKSNIMDEANATTEKTVDVSNDQTLIKDSQENLSNVDVLICGSCYQTYHFIEEFQEHKKANNCVKAEKIDCKNEDKPQIWGFTIWKTKQLQMKLEKDAETPSSWDLYQKWIKLKQSERDIWIAAGKNLEYFNKIASSKIEPIPLDKDKNDADNKNSTKPKEKTTARRTSTENGKEEFNVEKIVGKRFNPKRRYWEYHIKWENYKEETWEPLDHLENCKDLIQEYENKIKAEKAQAQAAQAALTPAQPSRGRGRPRLNPLGSTGSPAVKVAKKPTTPSSSPASNSVIITTPGGRPQRTSKQKALNQVKQWCGNISDSDEPTNKRPFDDGDDSDDSFEKKMKLEHESEDTEEEEPSLTVKKSPKIIQYNNGVGKKIPDNVLIPDAKGIVRISQKQLPSLSSGVYIMSRSSGIIKLDPAASKIATSGGQAIVKVGPKMGQTQIKFIKKDDLNKINSNIQTTTTTSTTKIETPASPKPTRLVTAAPVVKTATMVQKKEPEKIKKTVEPVVTTKSTTVLATPKKTEICKSTTTTTAAAATSNKSDDESDYGLEDLEFPTDLPIPEPDSPPGDFVLDPTTGKIAGQEYPDPEPEPVISEIKENTTPSETIDNIVKLAAADITEEDLKPDEPTTVPPTVIAAQPAIIEAPISTTVQAAVVTAVTPAATVTIAAPAATTPTTPMVATIVREQKPVTQQSILNTAMANSNILQKTLSTPVSNVRQKVQPKILNQVVAKPRPTQVSPVVKTVGSPKPNTMVRTRVTTPVTPKPKFNISPVNSNLRSVQNVYSRTNSVAKKVGNAAVYKKTYGGVSKPLLQQQQQHNTVVAGTTTAPKAILKENTAPKQVISMPSLTLDDEPTQPTAVVQTTTQQQVAIAAQPQVQEEAVVQQQAEPMAVVTSEADLTQFALAAESERMYITGDDGTVYQVAGQNEEGQTILLTQDSDGQQQCLLVTNETIEGETQQQLEGHTEVMEVQQEPMETNEDTPMVAQLLRAEPPSPGGTHKVVVMLPTGEVMYTQMSSEEYAKLELDK